MLAGKDALREPLAGIAVAERRGSEGVPMKWLAVAVFLVLVASGLSDAQYPTGAADRPAAGENREQNAPGSAGPKDSGVVQRGAQPNPAEVRPGNRDGDAPSASAGRAVDSSADRRILGLPVASALVIGAAILVLFILGGVLIPSARRRDRARGNGPSGRP
jgi:hypothetical protein